MSIAELLLILIVALVVLGPNRMTTLARHAGRLWNQIQTFRDKFKQDWEQQLKQTQLDENQAKAKQADKLYPSSSSNSTEQESKRI